MNYSVTNISPAFIKSPFIDKNVDNKPMCIFVNKTEQLCI